MAIRAIRSQNAEFQGLGKNALVVGGTSGIGKVEIPGYHVMILIVSFMTANLVCA